MSVKTGRPRNAALDDALLVAAAELLAGHGYGSLSIDAVARRAGTTRPALYRRFRNRAELVVAVLAQRFGTDPTQDTGTLRGDLDALQSHQLELFGDPTITGALGGLLDELARDPELATIFVERFLAPRRAATGRIIERAVGRGEIPAYDDHEWICDLITGPLLMRAALPGLPPLDQRIADQTVNAALVELGAVEAH